MPLTVKVYWLALVASLIKSATARVQQPYQSLLGVWGLHAYCCLCDRQLTE